MSIKIWSVRRYVLPSLYTNTSTIAINHLLVSRVSLLEGTWATFVINVKVIVTRFAKQGLTSEVMFNDNEQTFTSIPIAWKKRTRGLGIVSLSLFSRGRKTYYDITRQMLDVLVFFFSLFLSKVRLLSLFQDSFNDTKTFYYLNIMVIFPKPWIDRRQ